MNDLKIGDFVTINGQEAIGELIAIKGNAAEVALGGMKISVKLNKLTKTNPPEEVHQDNGNSNNNTSSLVDTKEKMMHFKFELDLRGKMKEEVMVELLAWIDDALLLGVEEAKIIHGRGTGVIKDTVRAMLRKYKEVEKIGDEEKERRGDGVTVVKFKTT